MRARVRRDIFDAPSQRYTQYSACVWRLICDWKKEKLAVKRKATLWMAVAFKALSAQGLEVRAYAINRIVGENGGTILVQVLLKLLSLEPFFK